MHQLSLTSDWNYWYSYQTFWHWEIKLDPKKSQSELLGWLSLLFGVAQPVPSIDLSLILQRNCKRKFGTSKDAKYK